MSNWLYKLLGINPGQDQLRLDRLFFVQPWPVWVILFASIAVLGWAIFFYFRDGKKPSWALKSLMVAMRVLAMAILAVILWQPMLRSHRIQTTPSVVAVVLDESKSMGVKDRWQDAKLK